MNSPTTRIAGLALAGIAVAGLAVAIDGRGASTTPAPEAAAPAPGAARDPYYPADGNRGYDVSSYRVDLDYFLPGTTITARTTVTAVATDALRRFHLDFKGFTLRAVTVDGRPAATRRAGAHELVVTPSRPISRGDRFTTVVAYRGKPGSDTRPGFESGWFDATNPGGGFIAGEPHSCTFWYPCNDHPTDKARFELIATVPEPFAAVSVGAELPVTQGTRPNGDRVRTYHWRLREPTATYLTTVYIDELTFERSTLADGTPVVSAYGPEPGDAPAREARLPRILRVLSSRWGPYPAPQAGGIFVNGSVPFSLETYTRPIYTEGADVSTIVHENAHQWWGDNVSIRQWKDICLNECLASYSEWLWREHKGADLDADYRAGVAGTPWWFDAPLYDMGAGNEFDYQGVYLKGTYFVHALRNKVGDGPFFAAMRQIQREHAGGNLSMPRLRTLLESATGVDLASFWDEWVIGTGVPSEANLYPGDLAG